MRKNMGNSKNRSPKFKGKKFSGKKGALGSSKSAKSTKRAGKFSKRTELDTFGKFSVGNKYSKSNKPNRPTNFSKSNSKRESISYDMYVNKAQSNAKDQGYVNSITFEDFNLTKSLRYNLKKAGFVHPTEIQALCIPEILKNNDLLALASTGSGKTAAFLLPLISIATKNKNEKCLIVVPTRELAIQIQNEFFRFGQGLGLMDVMLVGGTTFTTQISRLKEKPAFVIATPGRLLDLYEKRHINLKDYTRVVFDEVDEMLDMGFKNDIQRINSKLPTERQTLFFSATISPSARDMSVELLKDGIELRIEPQKAVSNVEQDVIHFGNRESKVKVLHKLLINMDYKKVLIFVNTRAHADTLHEELKKLGHKVVALHGDKKQGVRMKTMRDYKSEDVDILVATDVAARGLDILDISHVINYDEPINYTEYIHRVGRTGRIGNKGYAFTFIP